MTTEGYRLARVFGGEADLESPEKAARTSNRRFVRGRTQIAVIEANRKVLGQELTAWEAYQAYGLAILEEAFEYGSAILAHSPAAVGLAIRRRREDLGLEQDVVARRADLAPEDLARIEANTASDIPMSSIERVAFNLGLDEAQLAFRHNAGSNSSIAARLKTLQSSEPQQGIAPLSPRVVATFAEAASVVRAQERMNRWLGMRSRLSDFHPSGDYGSAMNPAWRIGYQLADSTREILQLGGVPIRSMRSLTEEEVGVPVIQAELPFNIAGATISTQYYNEERVRGIVLNVDGPNSNPWVRRATLAHELGHVLHDPEEELDFVHVDSYRILEQNPEEQVADFVEQRANAFAINFLAPQYAVRRLVEAPISIDSLSRIMDQFGISYTASRNHVVNAHYRTTHAPAEFLNVTPSDEWVAAENFAADYFPIHETPIGRRGRFAGLVVACLEHRLISEDSAANYLNCDVRSLRESVDSIKSLYPEVFR